MIFHISFAIVSPKLPAKSEKGEKKRGKRRGKNSREQSSGKSRGASRTLGTNSNFLSNREIKNTLAASAGRKRVGNHLTLAHGFPWGRERPVYLQIRYQWQPVGLGTAIVGLFAGALQILHLSGIPSGLFTRASGGIATSEQASERKRVTAPIGTHTSPIIRRRP